MERLLIDYIRRPDSMDKQAIAHLRSLVEKYPYFQDARVLLLQALYRSHDPSYNTELRRSSPMIPNRESIFHLVEEKGYSVEEERKKFNNADNAEDGAKSAENLIDLFLQSLPQDTTAQSPMPVDATQDYIGYLLQTDSQRTATDKATDQIQQQEPPRLAGNDIIEDFLESGAGRIRLNNNDHDTDQTAMETHAEEQEEPEKSSEFLTEALAGIYIKQGKYESAAKIIRQISLNNPKKNRYFADQLRFLEKLIINNRNKQNQ